jgi:hypothetical protein
VALTIGSWNLRQLVTLGDHKLLYVPAFQRNYVWEIENSRELFDSLLRSIPIGNLTLAEPNFDIGVATLDTASDDSQGTIQSFAMKSPKEFKKEGEAASEALGAPVKCLLILDGQQRITSIYRVLKGIDRLYLVIADNADDVKAFGQLAKVVEDVTDEHGSQAMHLPLDAILDEGKTDKVRETDFDGTEYAKQLKAKQPEHYAKEQARYVRLSRSIAAHLLPEPMLSYVLSDASQEDLIKFFERSNQLGTALTFLDLLNAKTFDAFHKTKEQSFSGAISGALRKIDVHLRTTKNFAENFIRARSYEAIAAREPGKNPLKKDVILRYVKGVDIQPQFGNWMDNYAATIALLDKRQLWTIHDDMPFPLMAVPVFFFAKAYGFNDTKIPAKAGDFMRWWYWASVFSERYSYKTNEAAQEDLEILLGVAQKKKVIPRDYVDRLGNRLDSKEKVMVLNNAKGHFQRAILQLSIGATHAKCIFTGEELSNLARQYRDKDKNKVRKLDYHHIFPRQFLAASGYAGGRGNSIANMMYATPIAHRGISQAPSEYLGKKAAKELYPTALRTHFVPEDLYQDLISGALDGDYEQFLERRAEVIAKTIDDVAGRNRGIEVAKPFMKDA